MTSSELLRKLKQAGFSFDRQAKGSHEIWYNPMTHRRTVIPNHPGREVPKGTLRAILREAGISPKEFEKL